MRLKTRIGTGYRSSSTVATSEPGWPWAVCFDGHLAFTPLAAIHMAKKISYPSPMIQAHRPSLTGPRPPRARPPSVGRSCRDSR